MRVAVSIRIKTLAAFVTLAPLLLSLEGCYFFRKKGTGEDDTTATVAGQSLGPKAGGVNEAALAQLHAIATSHAPAGVRPDPDTVVRRLLLQFRTPGATVAREIGRVEQYRMLLGGASEDFVKKPSETYDATSLLAMLKVSEEVCIGLINPNVEQHPGWTSILPAAPDQVDANLSFLSQRLLGIPSGEVSSTMLTSLASILETAQVDGTYQHSSYVPVCATLLVDAQALLL